MPGARRWPPGRWWWSARQRGALVGCLQRIDDALIEVRGKPVTARRYRILGPAQPIDVWHTAEGEWIGLDARVDGRQQLSYRQQ